VVLTLARDIKMNSNAFDMTPKYMHPSAGLILPSFNWASELKNKILFSMTT
jgi:hypothetical protein